MTPAIFAVRLKERRLALSLTQEALGKLSGVSGLTISHYEVGRRQPDLDHLKALADALECSTDYLLGRDETGN